MAKHKSMKVRSESGGGTKTEGVRWRGFSFSGNNPLPHGPLPCSKREMEWVPFSLVTTPSLTPNVRWSRVLFSLATTPSLAPNVRRSGFHFLWRQPPPSLQMQDGVSFCFLWQQPLPLLQTQDGVGFSFSRNTPSGDNPLPHSKCTMEANLPPHAL